MLIIAYGSLYPFATRHPRPAEGAVLFLLETWNDFSGSRGDILANILLYMPLGFFGMLSASGAGLRRPLRFVALCGVGLSLAMELGQFYDAGRVTSMLDVYDNGLGTVCGAALARAAGPNVKFPFMRAAQDDPFPALLIATWFGYRLYPYVPTIDLHKYWHALWPVIRSPSLDLTDLFRFVLSWAFIACLTERAFGGARGRFAYLLLGGVEIAGKILILNNALKLADVIGVAAGPFVWRRLRARPRPFAAMAWAMAALIAVERLLPLHFGPAHAFGWIPFVSLMHGSIAVNTQSFLEKFFLYGATLWALIESGLDLWPATALLALGLFATSLAEIVMPGRSAEITDATMAFALALLYRALERRRAPPDRPPRLGEIGRDDPSAGG